MRSCVLRQVRRGSNLWISWCGTWDCPGEICLCLTNQGIWLGEMAELLKQREQRGFQSPLAVDKSGGKRTLDEPRVVDSSADFRVKMLDSTTHLRKSKAQTDGGEGWEQISHPCWKTGSHEKDGGQDEMITADVEINHVMCLRVKMGVSNIVIIISVNADTKSFWFSPWPERFPSPCFHIIRAPYYL